MNTEFLSKPKAARFLRISLPTLTKIVNAGKIKTHLLGHSPVRKRVSIKFTDLQEYVKNTEV